jgi:hypothetical protein
MMFSTVEHSKFENNMFQIAWKRKKCGTISECCSQKKTFFFQINGSKIVPHILSFATIQDFYHHKFLGKYFPNKFAMKKKK